MNIKDSYIHNGEAILKDILVSGSKLQKLKAGKDANDAYLTWVDVLDLSPFGASGHNHDDRYLKLSGGTMSNSAVVTFPANGTLRQTTAPTSNAVSIIEWYKGTTKNSNYIHSAQIGWHNTGDTDGAIYLVPYPTNTDPWASSVGLYIGKTSLKWNNNIIWHAGNLTQKTITLSTTAQTYITAGSTDYTIKMPSTDPYTSARIPTAHNHSFTLGATSITTGGTCTEITGPFAVHTDASADKAFSIRRSGAGEGVKHWVDDSTYHIDYKNDETYSVISLRIINTDSESPHNPPQTTDTTVYLDCYKQFYPNVNNTGSIGTTSYKWANMYATTFHGSLDGTSTYASNVGTSGTAGINYVTAANVISMYNWYNTITSTDPASNIAIDKWNEIVSFLAGITDTSTLSGILAGYAAAEHTHDYLPFYQLSSANCNSMSQGLTAVTAVASNQNASNHSAFLTITNIGTPFQLQIPDSSEAYIYKRYRSGSSWSAWSKLSAGYADSAGSVAWENVTGKPSTFTPSSHEHSYLPLSGGTMTLGEGLKFHADENYFGTNLDARIISLLDKNGTTCDGGLIIDERAISNGVEHVTELLRIRDSEFKWRGNTIWHAGNDGSGSSLDADLLDGKHADDFAISSHNHDTVYVKKAGDTMTGSLTLPANGLIVNSDGRDDAKRVIKAYGSAASHDGTYYLNFGDNPTSGNCGEIGFTYSGSGSSSNKIAMGFYGGNYLTYYYNGSNPGKLTVGTTSNYHTVLTNGNTYITNGYGVINGTTITLISNADTVDNAHLSMWYKHATAYPYGKSNKPWHKIATFQQSTNSMQINTSIAFYVSEFYSSKSYGIFTVRARAEQNTSSLSWLTVDFMVNSGIPTSDIVATWKNIGNNVIVINVYANRTGWSSYSFRKIEEQNWGTAEDTWITLNAINGNENCYASIPSDENQITSENIDINNNVASATYASSAGNATTATNVAWSGITNKPTFITWEETSSTSTYSLSNAAWTSTISLPSTAGSYILNITSGGSTLTGVFSIGTSDSAKDEISLHLHGNGPRLYARTNGTTLLLSSSDTNATSRSVTIKYRRMI